MYGSEMRETRHAAGGKKGSRRTVTHIHLPTRQTTNHCPRIQTY